MATWLGCDQVPALMPATSVTIGTFDGVHLGHRVLLDRIVADLESGLRPVVVTFDPHPLAVIAPDAAPLNLATLDHRLELLRAGGVQDVLVIQFTRAQAAESPERFATRVLARTLNARHVVVGRNFRFGHRAAGDVRLLAELGRELSFQVTPVDLASLPGGAAVVSSTAIRSLIAEGDVAAAAGALGRAHQVGGTVVHGDHRGRTLGYPTANLDVPEDLAVPADGVYAGRLRAGGEPGPWLPAAISVGTNPTFGAEHRRVEAFVLDVPASYDIYGQWADIEFVDRIRRMERFASVAELVAQMASDVRETRRVVEAGLGVADQRAVPKSWVQ